MAAGKSERKSENFAPEWFLLTSLPLMIAMIDSNFVFSSLDSLTFLCISTTSPPLPFKVRQFREKQKTQLHQPLGHRFFFFNFRFSPVQSDTHLNSFATNYILFFQFVFRPCLVSLFSGSQFPLYQKLKLLVDTSSRVQKKRK